MSDEPIKIKPDNARFMGSIFLGLAVFWLLLGWTLSGANWPVSDTGSKVMYVLGVLLFVLGVWSFDGAIFIYRTGISQKRLGVEKFINFDEISSLQFSSFKTAHSLVVRSPDALITMTASAFERATVLRVRRAILERVPGVEHNSIPSDEHYREAAETA